MIGADGATLERFGRGIAHVLLQLCAVSFRSVRWFEGMLKSDDVCDASMLLALLIRPLRANPDASVSTQS